MSRLVFRRLIIVYGENHLITNEVSQLTDICILVKHLFFFLSETYNSTLVNQIFFFSTKQTYEPSSNKCLYIN